MGFIDYLNDYKISYSTNELLKKHTTLCLGGACSFFVYPKSIKQLKDIIEHAELYKLSYKVLGNGSNVLISDNGFSGVVISTKYLDNITENQNKITVMSGCCLKSLINYMFNSGYSGIEGLCGIPATVGGAIFNNASSYDACISDYLYSVQTLCQGKIKKYFKNDCGFSYRKSVFQRNKEIIISATFKFPKNELFGANNGLDSYNRLRHDCQPSGKSCGCIFKNPKLCPAGLLIEKSGLKGYRIGGATVSLKHANFIEIENNCTSKDVFDLINYIKEKVKDKFNIQLVNEVEFIGDF